MDGEKISSTLNATRLPGLKFVTQPFIPVSGLYAGRRCGGVGIRVGDRAAVRAMNMGLEIAGLLQKIYPQDFDASKTIVLLGNSDTVRKLKGGTTRSRHRRNLAIQFGRLRQDAPPLFPL